MKQLREILEHHAAVSRPWPKTALYRQMRISPQVGATKPAMMLSSVDLQQPPGATDVDGIELGEAAISKSSALERQHLAGGRQG